MSPSAPQQSSSCSAIVFVMQNKGGPPLALQKTLLFVALPLLPSLHPKTRGTPPSKPVARAMLSFPLPGTKSFALEIFGIPPKQHKHRFFNPFAKMHCFPFLCFRLLSLQKAPLCLSFHLPAPSPRYKQHCFSQRPCEADV